MNSDFNYVIAFGLISLLPISVAIFEIVFALFCE